MSDLKELIATFRAQQEAAMVTLRQIERLAGVEPTQEDFNAQLRIIKETVADFYGLPHTVMGSKIRSSHFVRPRQIATFLARELLPNASLVMIAQGFRSDMDHGTVIHNCSAVTRRYETEPAYAKMVESLRVLCTEKITNASMPLFAAAGGGGK